MRVNLVTTGTKILLISADRLGLVTLEHLKCDLAFVDDNVTRIVNSVPIVGNLGFGEYI